MRASPRLPRWVSFLAITSFRRRLHAGCAPAARGSRRRRRPAASGFRRPGTSTCRPWRGGSRSAGVKMPLSPTTMRSAGPCGASARWSSSVVSKVFRLRLLMPISRDLQLQRARRARLVVHLDQHVHAVARTPRPPGRLRGRVVDRRHDDQDAVGAPGARLGHLIGLVHEILAQRRQRGRRARRGQDTPACPGTTARRSAPTGRPRRPPRRRGQRRRIEVGADQALRRARLLDLGDQRVVAGGDACARSRARKPRGAGARLGGGLDLGIAAARAWPRRSPRACRPRSCRGCRSWLSAFDTAISRSSRPSAAPESIDLRGQRRAFLQSPWPCRRRPAPPRRSAARRRGTGPWLALEHVRQRRRIGLGVAAAQRLGLRRREPDILRIDLEGRAPCRSPAPRRWSGPRS